MSTPSPYEDPAVSAGEIADYLYSIHPQLLAAMNQEQIARAKDLFTTAQDLMWKIKELAEEITDPTQNEVLDELLSAQRTASECRLHIQAAYLGSSPHPFTRNGYGHPKQMIPAITAINQAFEELEEWCDDHALVLADEELPSALVVTVDPRSTPNARARICGEPDHLVQALLIAARGNEAFRDALTDALPQLMNLASQRT